MTTTPIAAGPNDVTVRRQRKLQLAHLILALSAALGSVIAWGWLGPFAGTIWSMGCFILGAMFGMLIGRDINPPNAEVRGDAPPYGAASLSTDGLCSTVEAEK